MTGDKLRSVKMAENSHPDSSLLLPGSEEEKFPSSQHRPIGTGLETQELYTVHIWNIPESLKKTGIVNLCRKFGKVIDVDAGYQNYWSRSGKLNFVNVSFGRSTEAETAISSLRGKLGLRTSVSTPRDVRNREREAKKLIDEKKDQEAFMRKKRETEFFRKNGIGPLTFYESPLGGRIKVFQDIAASRSDNLFVSSLNSVYNSDSILSGLNFRESLTTTAADEIRPDLNQESKEKSLHQDDIDTSKLKALVIGQPVSEKSEDANDTSCSFCSEFAVLFCGRCRQFPYCSKQCQAKHWRSGHRELCKEPIVETDSSDAQETEKTTLYDQLMANWSPAFACELDKINNGDIFQVVLDRKMDEDGRISALLPHDGLQMYYEMGDEFAEIQSSGRETEQALDVRVGNLLVRVHDDQVDRFFVTKVEGRRVCGIAFDHAEEISMSTDDVVIYKQMPKHSELSSFGLILEPKKKLNQFKGFLKKALASNGYTSARMEAKIYDQNNRICFADCVILDTENKPLLKCRVVPWYKHKTLEATFLSVDNVEVASDSAQEVHVEPSEEAASDVALGDQAGVEEPSLDQKFSVGDKLIWLNFSKFSSQLIVAKFEQDQAFKNIEQVLADSPETLHHEPVVGQVISVKRGSDGQFYRARVLEVFSKKNDVKVLFIDLGSESIESYQNIYKLPDKLATSEFPDIALTIELDGVTKQPLNKSKLALALCHLLSLFRSVLTVTRVSSSGRLTLIHPNGDAINDLMEQKLHEDVFSDIQGQMVGQGFDYDLCHVATFPADRDLEQSAFVTHVESPTKIWLCPSNQIGLADHLMEQVQNFCAAFEQLRFLPRLGSVCLVRSNVDNAWYRGVCLGNDEDDKVSVLFADFGFVESVEMENLRSIGDFLMAVPFMANHCILDGFEDFTTEEQEPIAGTVQKLFPPFAEEIRVKVMERKAGVSLNVIQVPRLEKELCDLKQKVASASSHRKS